MPAVAKLAEHAVGWEEVVDLPPVFLPAMGGFVMVSLMQSERGGVNNSSSSSAGMSLTAPTTNGSSGFLSGSISLGCGGGGGVRLWCD